MTQFLTRKRDGQKFPVVKSSRKKYRAHYDNPSWSTKHAVKTDIKHMHRGDNTDEPQDHTREYDLYKKKLQYESDKQHLKSTKKTHKKQEKYLKKQQKEAVKQMKKQEQQENQIRDTIQSVEGNNHENDIIN